MKVIVGFLKFLPLANRKICQLNQLALVQLWEDGEKYNTGPY